MAITPKNNDPKEPKICSSQLMLQSTGATKKGARGLGAKIKNSLILPITTNHFCVVLEAQFTGL